MTKLRPKPLKRETFATERTRTIIVEAYPFFCQIRLKGTKEFHNVPWTAILDLGRKLDFREQLAQRKRA